MKNTSRHYTTIIAATAGLLVLVAALPSPARASLAVDLLSEASVGGSVVKLSDIAIVSGDGAEAQAGRIICPAPAEGETLVVSPEMVRRRLLAISGRADIHLTGAASCRVTRSGGQVKAAAKAAAPQESRTLRQVLLAQVQASVGRPAERLKIEFDERDANLLSARESDYSMRLRTVDSGIGIGTNSIGVDLYETDRPQRLFRSASIRVRVLLLEDVVVAARDLKPGEIIKSEDVRLERAEFASDDLSRCFRDPRGLIGATVRVAMNAGRVIDIGDLTKTLLVQRGSAVTVYVEARGLSVRTISRALESGELGDVIAVQGKEGRGQFYAEVIGSATVRVRTAGADAQAAAAARDNNVRLAGRR